MLPRRRSTVGWGRLSFRRATQTGSTSRSASAWENAPSIRIRDVSSSAKSRSNSSTTNQTTTSLTRTDRHGTKAPTVTSTSSPLIGYLPSWTARTSTRRRAAFRWRAAVFTSLSSTRALVSVCSRSACSTSSVRAWRWISPCLRTLRPGRIWLRSSRGRERASCTRWSTSHLRTCAKVTVTGISWPGHANVCQDTNRRTTRKQFDVKVRMTLAHMSDSVCTHLPCCCHDYSCHDNSCHDNCQRIWSFQAIHNFSYLQYLVKNNNQWIWKIAESYGS